MYGFISGMTETNDISYCPKCGAEITSFYGDGTAKCDECGYHFGVVECEEELKEKKQKGIAVARHINGITLNPLEYLLDDEGELIVFPSEERAKKYFRDQGCDEEEIYWLVFEEV